jgi:hypothetical protein
LAARIWISCATASCGPHVGNRPRLQANVSRHSSPQPPRSPARCQRHGVSCGLALSRGRTHCGVGRLAIVAPSGSTSYTPRRRSLDGSVDPPRDGVPALYTMSLFIPSPKVGKNLWLSVSRCIFDIRFLDFAPKIELCDRTLMLPGSTTHHENRIYQATQTPPLSRSEQT